MAKKAPPETRSLSERLDSGRATVDSAMSFIDWIRYVITWVKDLFGRG